MRAETGIQYSQRVDVNTPRRGGRTRIRPPGFRLDCDGPPVLGIERLRDSFPGPAVELPIQAQGRMSGRTEGERKILHPYVRYRTERPRRKG